MRTSLACLALALPCIASQHGSKRAPYFENTAIVRAVELGGSLVHITTTYAIKALEDGSDVYSFALTPEEKAKTSWIQARVKGQQQTLEIWDAPPNHDTDRSVSLRLFTLPAG